MKRPTKLSPKGAKIVAALERFRDAIEAGSRSSNTTRSAG